MAEGTEQAIPEWISALKNIKRDEVSEREFYEKVLSAISGMRNVSLIPETAEQLKETLQEIGCITYSEWKEQNNQNGEQVIESDLEEDIEKGNISAAVILITQLLGTYENADWGLSVMLNGDEKSKVSQWLESSQKQRKDAVVQRILVLAKKRQELKREIAEEEQKKENDIRDLNDN